MYKRVFTDSRIVPAPPEEIFAMLADPGRHSEIDGSGTVQKVVSGAGPMQLGSKFKMAMKMYGFPYKTTSTVVEFEENRRIAWCHWGKNRWRYELEPVAGGTLVTESADFTTSPAINRFMAAVAYTPESFQTNIAATLDNLVSRFSPEDDHE